MSLARQVKIRTIMHAFIYVNLICYYAYKRTLPSQFLFSPLFIHAKLNKEQKLWQVIEVRRKRQAFQLICNFCPQHPFNIIKQIKTLTKIQVSNTFKKLNWTKISKKKQKPNFRPKDDGIIRFLFIFLFLSVLRLLSWLFCL